MLSQIVMEIMIKVPKKKLFVFLEYQKKEKSGWQLYQETIYQIKKTP